MQLVVARIGRAHGIKGEVTVEVRTDEPELRLGSGAVLATEPASAGPLTIESGRVHSGRLLLRFEGVRDRTDAEALRNTLLIAEVDPEELPEDPEEFYDHQLIDLDVVTVDGTEVGRISEISHLPYQDLLVVKRPDGGEVLIPFVSEVVPEIDLEEQRAVIDPPPGLLDETEAEIAGSRDKDAAGNRKDETAGGRQGVAAGGRKGAAADSGETTGDDRKGDTAGGREGESS
ncbi:ribosome maturation factor RimM [Streptomyces rugosispiralis]|uniref:Ribosome maturation factor RimM n=1 Tax=Streptomyces rugosispiralis TaxID=2967341 RepID=A0ABT1UW89_9ACTN|nr:ribosome maturation factor RimM [Streptomyces rugosispiralis]MCQ8189392.1 ribosome maturation factor RimM [Streptomyces rugosispiralis]